ncbi:MAG: PA2779 family protein [Bdellovibrionota bacterium]
MSRLGFVQFALVMLLSVLMARIPEAVAAETISSGMISTSDFVESLSRTELESKIRSHLDRDELQREFAKYGITADEIKSRLATLSNAELNRLAEQMDQTRYGGDVVGILLVVLIVLMIIYFAKRI